MKATIISPSQLTTWFLSLTRVDRYNMKIKVELLDALNKEREKHDVKNYITDSIFMNWRRGNTVIPEWAMPIIQTFMDKTSKDNAGI